MPPAFDDVRFPAAISRGASGGPERRTEIVTLASGREERNTRWADSRRRYNAGMGIASLDQLHDVLNFFEERRGRLHGFRWKDHSDFQSCPPQQTPDPLDQQIGVGDGSALSFQLRKTYGTGLRNYQRTVTKPVAGSVRVALAGVETSQFTVDSATGVVTFLPGEAPSPGASVTAGFQFDVPVRFDTDRISINLASFAAGEIPDIAIVEIKS